MAMLATVNKSSARVSKILRIVLAAVALEVLPAPLVYLSPAHAEAPKTEFLPAPAPCEARILKALEEPTAIEFLGSPLQNVVEYLEERHGIQIKLDVRALEDAGVEPATPVSCSLRHVTLKSALRLMLRDLQLAYIIQDEVLLITSKDVAESAEALLRRAYPVGDLAEKGNYDALIETITSAVRPNTWDEVGGNGVVVAMPAAQCIVVLQTRDTHDEVLELLRALRGVAHNNGAGSTNPIPRVGGIF
jgi:hypothetical protein